ncbi:hypothetical protein EMIHUDRAFT_231803 [Emiliania huxleyi CCMP1516]|uniref:Chromo domain-containing protein n=2 Tax=Emiliania huxleyi TaxID=2903 RepID=A0A0D3K767_EMIH1|nr:hypothetical protein EMIHUDRAFT_231803 [Emiliania huxleyi CCMP1516]EOD31602.1 hypothetical protein EMIHUDRAFT_231803 [Emiliania huxleyi CCMP1516]|eukprot:XP_005784031.1 hypothetical protein EMIHUDRAFT_231803 [Emiliania huxleyi CCMP1516]
MDRADRAAGTALPPEEGGVELVSADDVLKGGGGDSRGHREAVSGDARQRVDNYLGEGAFRVEAVRGERRGQSGAVEYEIKWEGYASDENTWEEAEDVSADLVAEWHRERAAAAARGDMQVEAGGAGEGGTSSGGVGTAGENTTGAARPGCSRVLRSALADALAEEWGEEEALLGDEVPLLSPHGPDLSKHLRHLRRLLREFLAEEAKEGTGVPMQCTPTGQHPTMRWTIKFGRWLATTRLRPSKASRWHFEMQGDARAEEVTWVHSDCR